MMSARMVAEASTITRSAGSTARARSLVDQVATRAVRSGISVHGVYVGIGSGRRFGRGGCRSSGMPGCRTRSGGGGGGRPLRLLTLVQAIELRLCAVLVRIHL